MTHQDAQQLCHAATVCADEHQCASHLSKSEWLQISAMVIAPTLFLVVIPVLSRCVSTPAALSLAQLERELAVPLLVQCARGGIIVAIFVFIFGFCVTFFFLLASAYPCSTALGECGSISCACGNVLEKGYVFMFVMLVLVSTHLARDFSALQASHGCRKTILMACSLGISLTGVFPEHFSQDVISPDALFRMSYALHSLGLFSAALLVIIPFSWLLRNAVAMRAIRLRVVGMRALVFLAVLLLSVIYLSYHERPDVIDQCALLSQAEHCEAWGHLDAAQCALLAGMDGARVHDYACGWINHTLTPDERLLLPADFVNFHDGKCVRERCPLFRYARSTALEYACLLLTAFYIGYYSVPDALALSRADTHAEAVDSLLNDGMIERRIRPSDESA